MIRRCGLLIGVLFGGLLAWLALQWYEAAAGEAPYSLIEEGLYVGGAVAKPPRGTRAVLNLCQQEDPYTADKVRWDPIDGTNAPSIEWLRRNVEFIDTQRRAGDTTYVHCLAGMNRSGMVITAYLMYKHGWTREQALKYAQAKRPQIQPNPTLMRVLDDWERQLRQEPDDGLS